MATSRKKIAMCLKKNDTSLAYRCLNKLNRHIRTQKDCLNYDSNKNVVYKLECSTCETTYEGQTKHKLKTRVGEHRKQINRNTDNYNVVTKDGINTGYEILIKIELKFWTIKDLILNEVFPKLFI